MQTKTERTCILLKPSAIERGLVGKIVQRFEDKGFKIITAKALQPTKEQVEEHYAPLKSAGFYKEIVECLCSGKIFVVCFEREYAINIARKFIGATWPHDAQPGTIRGDFAYGLPDNLIHGSDNDDSAERELRIWFPELFK